MIKEVVDGKYAIHMPVGLSEKFARDWGTTYQKGIINQKESYVFMDGEWKDYSDENLQKQLAGDTEDEMTFDNFPIKGYCTETNNELLAVAPDGDHVTLTVKDKEGKWYSDR